MDRHVTAAAVWALFLWAPACWGQGLTAKVEAPGLEEGRPGAVRVTWTNAGAKPLLVARLEVRASQAQRTWRHVTPLARTVAARSLRPLADELVSLTLTASEAMHPAVARLPLPPVEVGLAGAPMRLVRVVAPGKSVTHTLDVIPGAGRLTVDAAAFACAVPPRAYARGGVTTWTTARVGDDGPGIRPRRSDPLGARGAGKALPIRVRLIRWLPWRGAPASELLVAAGDAEPSAARSRQALATRAAAFSQAAAQTRANVSGVGRAVRLSDGRWILQGGGRYWVVGPKGPVLDGRGSLFPLALDLAKRGKGGFSWRPGAASAGLAAALQRAKLGVDRGKAWSVQIPAARLAEYLKLLSTHGVYPDERGIARKPPGPAASKQLTIDAELLPNYPAALVSLDDGKVRSLPPRKQFKGWEAKGDLWVEPDDPEIAALGKRFEGAVHPGLDTQVAAVAVPYDRLTRPPKAIAWKRALAVAEIKAGRVFLVRSSSGKLYKVGLITVEPKRIVLRYARLTP